MNLLIVIVVMLILLIFGMPIALIMALSGITYFVVTGSFEYFPMAISRLYSGIDSFTLICIPFFILAGDMMTRSGITERLVRFSNLLVGRLPGNLAQANVLASGIFASISGSALGDIAAIGSVFIPAMKREGYSGRFTAAVTAASSIVSPIIPPSLIIIIYASVIDASIGAMFVAAVLPGFLMIAGDMAMVHLLSVKRHYPKRTVKVSPREALECTRDAMIALLMPLIIIGGIVGGVFTPTEAAAVAVAYALVIGLLVFRNLSPRDIATSMFQSALSSGKLFFIIACVGILAWAFAMEEVPQQVVTLFDGMLDRPWLILLTINIFLLFMGMWLDLTANIFLFAPIFVPLITALGIDPLHFSIIFLLNVNLGNITPPLGIVLFATSELSREKAFDIARELGPFWTIKVCVLALVTYLPWITLWLPGVFGFIIP
jgi:tripartite ATP-independent transporter DctM subunit